MEQAEINTIVVILLAVAWNMFKRFKEKTRPRRIAIVEDSDSDFQMYKMFLHLDNTIIDRYRTADNLPLAFAKNRPDVVIADYYLEGHIRGDEVLKLCDKLRIPSRLVTGHEGDIIGVNPDRITRKTAGKDHVELLQSWCGSQLA